MLPEKTDEIKCKINQIGITNDTLTSRAGLLFLSRYVLGTKISELLAKKFSFLRKSSKGIPLASVFHQLLCFFLNGESFHLSHFDQLKNDSGYTGILESNCKQLLSSHSAKRFFTSFQISSALQLRKILHILFVWQLKKEKPTRIILGIDTMLMDNDDALRREGVDPTYKKVKGFQPLHMYWWRFIVDTIFRNGSAHSNHGNNVQRMVKNAVRIIRKYYSATVPIVLLADTGFFDQKLFLLCTELNVGFIVGGKMYPDIKKKVAETSNTCFFEYKLGKKTWFTLDFEDQRKSWDTAWRCIYTKPITDDCGQVLLDFERPESLIYTNLGMDNTVTKSILSLHNAFCIDPEAIITAYHNRARDELVNRAFKDFGTERLPFKRFAANSAFYYLMTISFFLFESFKYDIEIVPVTWYPSTFRRNFIDAAAKLVHTARKIILKFSAVFHARFSLTILWEKLKIPILLPVL